MMSSSTKCNSNVLQVQHMVHYNVQHQGMLHVFRVYLGATIAALFQQIAFPHDSKFYFQDENKILLLFVVQRK